MTRLAIVGSVDLNAQQYEAAVYLVTAVVLATRPDSVITGGASGVDTIAMDVTQSAGIPLDVRWPDVASWNPLGRRGFRARNVEIAEWCNELIAIRSLQSKTYGSGWTADYAESIGKKVRRYYV